MDEQEVLQDFAAWSGGFSPAECDEEQIRNYLRYGRPDVWDADEVATILATAKAE